MTKEIIIYGADWCIYCKLLKAAFDDQKVGYTFKDIDIEENNKQFLSYQVSGVPLMIVKDTETKSEVQVRGFDLNAIEKATNIIIKPKEEKQQVLTDE